jgi:multisubunit Na+/H+ antiporter MnhE subunit
MIVLRKVYYFIVFLGFYLVKLISANLFIAYDILTPRMRTNPGMIEVKLKLSSNFGILLFSNLVSMTPGTLSMDLDREKSSLLVHLLYMDRREATEKELERIMKLIRQLTE